MEFGLREVLILVGLVVIAGILFDGYRRMRKSKLGELELPSEMGGSCEDDWEFYKGELPNGGARKIPLSVRRSIGEADPAAQRQEPEMGDSFGSALEDNEVSFSEEEVVAERRSRRKLAEEKPRKEEPAVAQRRPSTEQATPEQEYVDELVSPAGDAHTQDDLFADDDLLIATRAEQQAQLTRKTGGKRREEQPAEVEIDPELQEVLVINVMARTGELEGHDLLRVMLSCGFRFGDMNIFHRYEQHSGKGSLLFSAANVVEPGVFDVDRMEEFSTPGICMFMKLPGPKRPIHAFEIMMDSARKIANLLDADIKDEHHNVMRQQTAEHYRQRVLDFERRFLSYKKALQKQH